MHDIHGDTPLIGVAMGSILGRQHYTPFRLLLLPAAFFIHVAPHFRSEVTCLIAVRGA